MIVLDTHIWVNWILGGDAVLTPAVVDAMQTESHLAVSAISCFAVSLWVTRGKLELPFPVNEWLTEALASSRVESLCEAGKRGFCFSELSRPTK